MPRQRKHLPAEERRLAIVHAVLALAARSNPDAITTAAIAGQMGLTQGALFRHFDSKEAVLAEVMRWARHSLLAHIGAATAGITSPLATLEAAFLAHAGFVGRYPGIPRLIFSELQRADNTAAKQEVQLLMQEYGKQLFQWFEAGKQQGELAGDLDTLAAIPLFIGSLQGLVMQSLLMGNIDRIRQDAPRIFRLYCNGIRSTT